MNRSLAKLLTALNIGVILLSYVILRSVQTPSLEGSIRRLNSDDFGDLRRAQSEICAHGRSALVRLRQSVLTSNDVDEAAKCCDLIGYIDPKAYGVIVLDAVRARRLEQVTLYPNVDAIRALSVQARTNLAAKVEQLHLEDSEYKKDLAQLLAGEEKSGG